MAEERGQQGQRTMTRSVHTPLINHNQGHELGHYFFFRPTTTTMTMQDPLAGASPLKDIVRPQFHQVNLRAENFIKNTIGLKLDKGEFVGHPDLLCTNDSLGT